MTALLTLVTLLSLASTAAMAVAMLRMRREERRRSDARVEALARMAGPVADPANDLVLRPNGSIDAQDEGQSGAWFDDEATESERPAAIRWMHRRPAIIGAAGVGVALGLLALAAVGSRVSRAPASNIQAQAATPLRLTALDHTPGPGALTVSGRVENPRGAPAVSNVTATVFLFDAQGAFLTSGRAPLGVADLAAGQSASFSVTVPVNGIVARYRVSFRDRTGRAMAHVDARGGAALASNQ